MKACRLTNAVFLPEERREARSRIQAIANGELVGKAVSETIASAQMAMMAAVNAAIVASAASSSSSSNQ
ncbi:hypothetical protein F7734_46725 [Scytonema sp. UIC 10036]|nr:hypothetical protein [Scytonema sp. UIC 10036]MUG99390.1 hypothetical protein [Scytonema sp. UIC 10036]